MDTLRLWANRLLGRETILEVELFDALLRFSIKARREIRRVRSLSDEFEFIERMLQCLSPGDVVYDVGSNIGVTALLLGGHPDPAPARVYCFEPEPRNFDQLLRNVRLNELDDRIEAHRLALSDRAGELALFVRGGPGEGRHSTVVKGRSTHSIAVDASTAADFARERGEPPDFVKIDVEGAEGRVLQGMEPLLREKRPRDLFLEIHPKGDEDRMPDGTSISRWLGERGYRLAWERERGRSRHRHYR
jgi:FkbM family methyltransferase